MSIVFTFEDYVTWTFDDSKKKKKIQHLYAKEKALLSQ